MGKRKIYAVLFVLILITEICIALFLDDPFIRPYGGDILVTVLIGAFIRMCFPNGIKLLSLWVFCFSVAVEIGQYFNFATKLFGDNFVMNLILGNTFSAADVVCYVAGCVIFVIIEYSVNLHMKQVEIRTGPVKEQGTGNNSGSFS